MSSQSELDHPERHTYALSTSGGRARESTGGNLDDPSNLKAPVAHHCSHCVNFSMFPHRSMPQRATYTMLVIVLFNVQVLIIHYAIS